MIALATLVLAAVRTTLTVREVRPALSAPSSAEARTDELTGLSNRRHLIEAIDAGLAAGIDTTLVMIDLDRFKDVNDSLGHGVGDRLLVLVGERLRRSCRPQPRSPDWAATSSRCRCPTPAR